MRVSWLSIPRQILRLHENGSEISRDSVNEDLIQF